MKKLEGLRFQQHYITQLDCIKGCLDYLGRDISFPWLYGGTGYAFVLNIHKRLDPSGPTCWDTQPIFDLAPNLGFQVNGFSIEKDRAGEAFPEKQRQAWDFVRANLDRGLPCYGWEVDPFIPDYSIIFGYEDDDPVTGLGGGYLYSGWVTGGPCDWRTLGETDVTVLQVYAVELRKPAEAQKVVREALSRVIQKSTVPDGWFSAPGYASGLAAYELWAEAVEKGRAIRDGHSYNNAAWLECREMALAFLQEARQKLAGKCDEAFDAAATQYAVVCERLRETLALHPFRPETWDNNTRVESAQAAALLRQACVAEQIGLASLQTIIEGLA
jgi:hypothetical protein